MIFSGRRVPSGKQRSLQAGPFWAPQRASWMTIGSDFQGCLPARQSKLYLFVCTSLYNLVHLIAQQLVADAFLPRALANCATPRRIFRLFRRLRPSEVAAARLLYRFELHQLNARQV